MPPITLDRDGRFVIDLKVSPILVEYIRSTFEDLRVGYGRTTTNEEKVRVFKNPIDIPQLLIWYLQHMYKNKRDDFLLSSDVPRLSEFQEYINDFEKIDAFLDTVK